MASPHPQLTAGIAAFQAEDYPTAITHLQQACADLGGDGQLQAQGWLVRAYVKAQQVDAARQLCGELTQCDRPKIRTWAAQTLAQLPAFGRPIRSQPICPRWVNSANRRNRVESGPHGGNANGGCR
jgi:hypothetical protein